MSTSNSAETCVYTANDRVYRFGGSSVAVLYSPKFGSGWSTGNPCQIRELLMFSPTLVMLVLDGKQDKITKSLVLNIIRDHGIEFNENKLYLGDSPKGLKVEWVPRGVIVNIREYDGSETVKYHYPAQTGYIA